MLIFNRITDIYGSFGLSLQDCIRTVRLEEAKRMTAPTGELIETIAQTRGFGPSRTCNRLRQPSPKAAVVAERLCCSLSPTADSNSLMMIYGFNPAFFGNDDIYSALPKADFRRVAVGNALMYQLSVQFVNMPRFTFSQTRYV